MGPSLSNDPSMKEKGLRYHLLIIEFLVIVIPFLILFYIFYRGNVFLGVSQMALICLTLVLILCGLISLRQIFDRFSMLATSLNKAQEGEKIPIGVQKDTSELYKITDSFNRLMNRLEETAGDLQQRIFELFTIRELTEIASKGLDFEELLNLLLDKAMAVSQAQIGSVLTVEPERDRFRVIATRGLDQGPEKGSCIDITDTLLQCVASEKKALLVEDIENDPRTSKVNDPKYGTPSFLSIPIFVRENLLGVLNLACKENHQVFDSHDEHIVSIMAGETGFILDNGRLHSQTLEHVKDLQEKTVELTEANVQLQKQIAEREEIERKLEDTNKFLKNILDSSSSISIISTDLEQNIVFWNKGAERMFGYKKEEIVGHHKIDILYPDDETKRGIDEIKSIIAKGTSDVHKEVREVTKDGRTIWVSLNATPRFDASGDMIGMLGIGKDITERKRAEEEKKKLEAQLQQTQKLEALVTLAGGMAHNFNNLLMNIQGNTSLMLLDTDPQHSNYTRLKNIEESVQSGSRLTRQLLGYARGGKYEIKPLNLNHLVEQVSETFSATKKEITVHRALAKDLYGIMADQGQIEQILWNLYLNAAEAMPQGGDIFSETMNSTHTEMVSRPYKVKPGKYVLLRIRDTGVGMDRETVEHIFEPFFTTKSLSQGTGLGLASVYGIVKAHAGYIEVDSDKGKGTVFSIYFPASEKNGMDKEVIQEVIERGEETLLFVDDEEGILKVSQEMLQKLGYTVISARSGKEALDIYKDNQDTISLVILDMIMPDMGGGESYDQLKAINPDVKVLLSTGYSIDGQASEILNRGCDGFIQKPFNMRELSQKIRDTLDGK